MSSHTPSQIVYAFFGTYPEGPAAARRIQLVCRGLQAAGVQCTVLALSSDPNASSVDVSHDRYGIRIFRVPHPLLQGKVSERLRNMERCRHLLAQALESIAAEGGLSSVILYNDLSRIFIPLLKAARNLGVKVLADCTEDHGFHLFWLKKYHFWDQALFRRRLLRGVDALIGISSYWNEVASTLNIPCITIPALADIEEPDWPQPARTPGQPFILGYIGGLADRDLPKLMLKTIASTVAQGLSSIRLNIIGSVPADIRASLERGVRANELLRDRVCFTGKLSPQAFRQACISTHAFLFLRKDSKEVRACFPTRLPEQLLSRRPVIASSVGDFPLYLRHHQNALLIPSGQELMAAQEAIQLLASDHRRLVEVGAAGRATAISELSFQEHGRRLTGFLRSLLALNWSHEPIPITSFS